MKSYAVIIRWLFVTAVVLLVVSGRREACAAQTPVFTVHGAWSWSALPGATPGKPTIYSSEVGAAGVWMPRITSRALVNIWIWTIIRDGNDADVKAEVAAGGKTVVADVDMTSGSSGWVSLGSFRFSGEGDESVRVVKSGGEGYLRLSAIRFDITDDKNPALIWQRRIEDDVTPYAVSVDEVGARFNDLPLGSELSRSASDLVDAKILDSAGESTFAPKSAMTRAQLRRALNAMFAAEASGPNDAVDASGPDFARMAADSLRSSGRNIDWVDRKAKIGTPAELMAALGIVNSPRDPVLTAPKLDRGDAALLLERLRRTVVLAGPPAASKWRMTFCDNFSGNRLDNAVWAASDGETREGLLSSRWHDNVSLHDGLMSLVTRKENRGRKEWTSGLISTRDFTQMYGYFEAKYRYAGATGLNQAFWLRPRSNDFIFEIDINEGHYPNEICSSLHQDPANDHTISVRADCDLSLDFHVYGCLWTPTEVAYYLDGKQIAHWTNTKAHLPCPILFSTAVIPAWGGPVTNELNGKSMDVDWVRAYQEDAGS